MARDNLRRRFRYAYLWERGDIGHAFCPITLSREFETKAFKYDRGIRLLADVMDAEEAGVLDCFVAAGSELQHTRVALEADAFTFSEIAGHDGVSYTLGPIGQQPVVQLAANVTHVILADSSLHI